MTRAAIMEKLTELFRDIFDDKYLTIDDATTSEDIESWDSLTHIMLLNAVEHEFGISLEMKAVQGQKNVGELVDMIEKKLG